METVLPKEITMDIRNIDGLELLQSLETNSINLVLTDPPYNISKTSGMQTFRDSTSKSRTEDDWESFKKKRKITTDENKTNYMNHGTIYGSKYSIMTDYGKWDSEFTEETLEKFIKEFYRVLKPGGTIIIFYDIWKITNLKKMLDNHNFKQLRFIEWIKTNPTPVNSNTNYLSNSREIALVATKKSKPTFNSKYDNGLYQFPSFSSKTRFHPTQKSLKLFETLISKHSNEGDTVLDTFLGGGTTAIACYNLKRNFIGSEINPIYYDQIKDLDVIKKNCLLTNSN